MDRLANHVTVFIICNPNEAHISTVYGTSSLPGSCDLPRGYKISLKGWEINRIRKNKKCFCNTKSCSFFLDFLCISVIFFLMKYWLNFFPQFSDEHLNGKNV